jgi:predicted phage-related endonuclease
MNVTLVEHDSQAWHDLRARHIGGSEIAALFDLPRGETPAYLTSRFALWHIKAGNAPPLFVDNPRVKWGLKLESVIAEAAAEEFGWTYDKGGYVEDETTSGLGCTLDFVIHSDPDETGPGALEAKNVDWLQHKRSWTGDEPPPHILLQLQHQLAATGYSWGAVVALVGGNDLRCYRYKARPRLIEDIRRRVREFWASIDAGQEPPVDGSDSASAVLAALYPEIIDDSIDMRASNEWAEAAHAFHTAAEARRAANDDYDEAKNRIVKLLDGHKRGWGNGWQVNTAITSPNPGREPKPGELIGKRAEVRKYTAKEMTA